MSEVKSVIFNSKKIKIIASNPKPCNEIKVKMKHQVFKML